MNRLGSKGRKRSNSRSPLMSVLVMLLVTLLFASCGCGESTLTVDDLALKPQDVGEGWELEGETRVDPATQKSVQTLSKLSDMGAEEILNQVFTDDSKRLQVNLIQMGETKQVDAALSYLKSEGGGTNIYGSRENVIAEIIGEDAGLKKKTARALGIDITYDGTAQKSGTAEASVDFELACVVDIDYSKVNELFNYLEGYSGGPLDPRIQETIENTSFGDEVSLLTSSGSALQADYSFEPESVSQQTRDGVTTYTFDASSLPGKAGVPYVRVKGSLAVAATDLKSGDGSVLTPQQVDEYTASTTFFPANHPDVQSLAAEISGSEQDEAGKIKAIWEWVRNHVDYSGPQGTRYGTLQVIQQRYGRCWDLSDVCVTICRASGVPARQVAGWLSDQDTGHVWSQAYLDGKGWIGVDTTSDRVGTGTAYLPFFATNSGMMPILYVSMPRVEEN